MFLPKASCRSRVYSCEEHNKYLVFAKKSPPGSNSELAAAARAGAAVPSPALGSHAAWPRAVRTGLAQRRGPSLPRIPPGQRHPGAWSHAEQSGGPRRCSPGRCLGGRTWRIAATDPRFGGALVPPTLGLIELGGGGLSPTALLWEGSVPLSEGGQGAQKRFRAGVPGARGFGCCCCWERGPTGSSRIPVPGQLEPSNRSPPGALPGGGLLSLFGIKLR